MVRNSDLPWTGCEAGDASQSMRIDNPDYEMIGALNRQWLLISVNMEGKMAEGLTSQGPPYTCLRAPLMGYIMAEEAYSSLKW